MTPTTLSYLLAVAGLACFVWPIVQRLRGGQAQQSVEGEAGRSAFGSPLWLAGFALTAAAIYFQRMGLEP